MSDVGDDVQERRASRVLVIDLGRPEPEPEREVPVLILDIDGTVRWGFDELGRFVNGPEDVVVFDGVREMLAAYREAGWRILGATNQGGITLGHVTIEQVMRALMVTNELLGEPFDKIGVCRHHPDAAEPINARCWCRKPLPGGVIDSLCDMARETRLRGRPEIYPPHLALFVGDRAEDEACAAALNVDFMWAFRWREGGHVIPVRADG